MNLRSPLSRVLGKGSARDGTSHWWGQRLSAVGLIILGLWFALSLLRLDSFSYQDVAGWIEQPLNSVLLILLCLTLAYHSNLGMRIIVEDYVHGASMKVVSLILNSFAHIFVLVAALFAIMKIALGAPL